MSYFVKIGPIEGNLTGVGSRGYHLYRRGTTVYAVWGPAGWERKSDLCFFWTRTTNHKAIKCRTTAAARTRLRALEEERVERKGYRRLPIGARIVRREMSRTSTAWTRRA